MKQLLTLICGAILLVASAQAQTSTSATTTTNNTTTSTTNSSGTVTDYTPGAMIVLDPGTGKPLHFVIGKKVQVLGPDGKVLTEADVKKNARVRLHLVQDGDKTVVDKIDVEEK